jgi:starvation-inducible DNA-binding protein
MMATKTFVTRNDLPQRVRDTMVSLLNQQLADTLDLYSQTKQAHWNIKGMGFIQLHKLFDDLAESVLDYVDMIAERATALGGYAQGTVRMSAANSTLPEFPAEIVSDKQVVEVLAERYAQYAATTRAAIASAAEIEDQDTADLFTEVSRAIDKHLWFLEAHLQDG